MIDQTITIQHATAAQIYAVLLDSTEHAVLTSDVADINPKVGRSFSVFGGYATGTITKLTPGKYIEQSWRASDWPKGHYSTLSFEFTDTPDGVIIHFVQSHLPKGTQKEFEGGWKDFYWEPLAAYFAA